VDQRHPSSPVTLPDGVTLADWALERVRWQNPRIKCLLGCYQLLDQVFESNFAILHCSPSHLREVWSAVRQVASTLTGELRPLLSPSSCIPALDDARQAAEMVLAVLDEQLLTRIREMPAEVPEDDADELRRLLCVAIGQLHAFILDGLGQLMAADPRSQHNVDYFLTRKFARDVDEAEWLHTSVARLASYVARLDRDRVARLGAASRTIAATRRLPSPEEWAEVADYLGLLTAGLTPRLKQTLGLRGIRFAELELLDAHSTAIPTRCEVATSLYDAGRAALDEVAGAGDPSPLRDRLDRLWSDRLLVELRTIDEHLCDLVAFVPVWLQGIENRRALLLKRRRDD
jgi:hypothetical protein